MQYLQKFISPTWLLGLILMLSALIRTAPLLSVSPGERLYFLGTDSYSFMRSVRYAVEHFPNLIYFDRYQGFPNGSAVNLSPLLVLSIAGLSKVAGFGADSLRQAEITGSVLPVVLGIATSLLLYQLARKYLKEEGALLAALFIAVVPVQVYNTLFANPDTNALEPFIALVFCLLFLRAEKGGSRIFYLILGGFLAAANLLWQGSILFTGLFCLYALVRIFMRLINGIQPDYSGALWALLSNVLLLWLLRTFNILGMQYAGQSGINLYLSVFGLLTCSLTLYQAKWLVSRKTGASVSAIVVILSYAVLSALAFFIVPGFVRAAVAYLGGIFFHADPLHRFIAEMQPLIIREGRFSYEAPTLLLTFFFWVFPLPLYYFLKDRSIDDRYRLFFLIWSLFNLVLALFHQRFATMFALNLAILFGYGISIITAKRLRRITAAAAVILIFVSAFPSFRELPRQRPFHLIPITNDLFPALEWMRDKTPDTGDYGVLSRWDFGYWIAYIAERPAIAVNSGAGSRTSARFLIEHDEGRIMDLLRENRVRYVIISDFASALPSMAEIAGRPAGMFEVTPLPDGSVNVPPAYYGTITTRLFLNDGNSFNGEEGLGHFKLVYESPNRFPVRGFGKEVKRVKVFEVVNGAVLKGRTKPNAVVSLSMDLVSNQGRAFSYRNRTRADDRGMFSMTAPYATDGGGQVRALPYYMTVDGASKRVLVTGEQVLRGEEVYVGGI